MRKYIGTYRIDMERDYYTDNPILEGMTWIRADSIMRKRGGKVYRFDQDTLVAYVPSVGKSNNIVAYMNENSIHIDQIEEYDDGKDIYFRECDLGLLEKILGLSTYGASAAPESIKNHKHKDQIREEKRMLRTEQENERYRLLGQKLMESRTNK